MQSARGINGLTHVVAHLAYPSAHVRTPALFNARCRERGIDAVLVPWQVHPDNLRVVMEAFRVSESLAGVVVTIPHKETVAGLCDVLEGPAHQLCVTNVVRKDEDLKWHGRALDGVGFVQGLEAEGHECSGRRVLLLGAGGVAVAIAEALAGAGVARLVIANRTWARAEKLAERVASVHPNVDVAAGPPDASGFDLVINATSVGMQSTDPLPLDVETIAPGTVAAEVIMEPEETPFLKAAAIRGAVAHAGRHMLTGQIDAFIDFVLPHSVKNGQRPGSLETDPQDEEVD